MLAAGTDVDERSPHGGSTPLHAAAFSGHEGVVRILLGAGADVAATDNAGSTPLHWGGRFEVVVRLLVEHGADVSAKANDGRTPEDIAMARSTNPALWTAAWNGRAEEVQQLLAAGADIEVRGGLDASTPLHAAASWGRERVMRLLISKGADFSAADNETFTPLHAAAMEGHEAVVRLLLGKGAEVSRKKKDGWTALHLAASNGLEGVVRLLLSKGADVSAKTNDGSTPEDVATMSAEHGIAAMLRAEAARWADPRARGYHEPLPPKPQVAYIQHAPAEFLREVELVASYRDGEKVQVQVQIP